MSPEELAALRDGNGRGRPLDPDKPYYHWHEWDGRLAIESECCADSFTEAEEIQLLRYLIDKHGNPDAEEHA